MFGGARSFRRVVASRPSIGSINSVNETNFPTAAKHGRLLVFASHQLTQAQTLYIVHRNRALSQNPRPGGRDIRINNRQEHETIERYLIEQTAVGSFLGTTTHGRDAELLKRP